MADISQITLPSGSTYDIKDATARSQIAALAGGDAVVFVGVSSTALTDGGNQTPTVGGEQKTPATGQLFFYGTEEFIYGADSKWHALGSLDTLGDLAYKDSASGTYNTVASVSVTTNATTNKTATVSAAASGTTTYTPGGSMSGITWTGASTTSTGKFTPAGSVTTSNKTFAVTGSAVPQNGTANYTPAGTVSTPTISVKTAGHTTSINNPTSKTVVTDMSVSNPSSTQATGELIYYSVSGEVLSLKKIVETTGASITTSSVTVKDGDAAYESTQPTFTGTGTMLTTATIKEPTGAFSGTEGNVSVTGTSAGSISSQGTFSGTAVRLVTGNIAVPDTYTATITSGTATVTVS